ncbi:cysteine desulfurase sulfur acceptor subunit CsdE [Vibrio mangrovi]|uniref:Cysteine desulfurase sulfur acceptor subunit CsdE n=1 Tax=Vibrio mangrovi TaxID=474394 RepID=A0A1Y6IRM2_9VIBR|nr:cysteine desulfurase sulfur acceptor subunit CsdE [Vibrio mangrovi]MDW6001669.1 cysteine desulfurase sulfur acceptor subunit CsdE [Vibrio mangrovi]SMS00304.1 Sulfur acceptor protein CsdE [Vibrio mangrovi]
MSDLPPSPFGSQITADEIQQVMENFHSWEDKYRQVIQWGKQLPAMPESLKSGQVQISGCESQVWLVAESEQDKWFFCADSDARIVRGLIAIVMAAYQGKTSEEIAAFPIEDYFSRLGLMSHLSPSRGNGLRAIVRQIQTLSQR